MNYSNAKLRKPIDRVELKKRVGLVSGTSLIVGTMIGSGIFISPKGLTEGSGSVGLSLVNWLLCGGISLLGALTYAELGTLITESGGEWAYLKEAFGHIPSYLYAWMSILLLRPASAAIIALTCAEYVMVPLFDDGCVFLTAVNVYSVKAATNIQVIFTGAKLLAMAIIIIGGIVKMIQGHTDILATGFDGTESSPGKIAIGLYNGMWAYDGWNNLNFVTEEIINPSVNLPRAIIIGLPLVTVLYLLVNISYFTVLSVPQLLASPAVAVTWGEKVIPDVAWIIPVFVALSTFGAANGSMFSAGRLTFVAAREGHLMELLSMVHVKKYTPLPSLIFSAVLSVLYILPGDIGSLIDFFNFAIWMFYGATAASCIVLRFSPVYKNVERPYKVPLIVPFVVLVASIFLVVAPIIDDPRMEFLYVTLFIFGGLIFYVPFVHYKWYPKCIDHVTIFFQLLFNSSSPKSEPNL
ncbi:hypothetical protein CAPTEDRAFT_194364 [Capitella teleta]|uniref:b(0,+)-type amino acid transporter 1 n=1 Tax=Capitella teleta TaxID=283909 RepID=R7V4V7_CAPTE|nr:hypothetical protein CAPTEDRAFT_194364 [Capitella teleta]|eukprot:ELU11396.1 hypothetical protein CAPTEDRAFT_194364 [Capitella teleta]